MEISRPTNAHRNGIIVSYTITITQFLNGSVWIHMTSEVDRPFTVMSLSPYTEYTYTVAASTVNGTGPASTEFTTITAEAGRW